MAKIQVVAAIVDEIQLTIYKTDGTTISLKQGDPRIRPILDKLTPILSRQEIGEIDLDDIGNDYATLEKKSGGLVRFFRVAKKAVANLFGGSEYVEPIVVGKMPDTPVEGPPTTMAQVEARAAQIEAEIVEEAKNKAAIEEILSNAEPVTSESFDSSKTTAEHTIVAVTEDSLIPGMENLEQHIGHAARSGDTIGMQNFLRRCGAVIKNRRHSVEDLLKFLKNAELPIADNGDIIAYKILYSQDGGKVFTDPHTRKVTQRPGSLVCMDESMVDPNRRRDCSNGLHVASRKYLSSFNGDTIFLIAIRPEDVIAVPEYDNTKMRVCAYHIIFKTPAEAYSLIKQNRPMTMDSEASKLLARALRNNYDSPDQEVRITQGFGGGLKISPIRDGKVVRVEDKGEAHAFDDPTLVKKHVAEVAKVQEAVTKASPAPEPKKEEPAPVAPTESRNEKAKRLASLLNVHILFERQKAANELLALKKASKVSWVKLGLSEEIGQRATNISTGVESEVKTVAAPAPAKTEPKKAAPKPSKKTKEKPVETVTETKTETAAPVKRSRVEEARHLYTLATGGDKRSWNHLWLHKKTAKISWEALGFNKDEIKRIMTNKPDSI